MRNNKKNKKAGKEERENEQRRREGEKKIYLSNNGFCWSGRFDGDGVGGGFGKRGWGRSRFGGRDLALLLIFGVEFQCSSDQHSYVLVLNRRDERGRNVGREGGEGGEGREGREVERRERGVKRAIPEDN